MRYNISEEMKLEDLGYHSFFEEGRSRLGLADFNVARVISESRGSYRIKDANGEYLAKVTGKRMFDALSREDYPAVGDWVVVDGLDNECAVIRGILPRASIIKRVSGDKIQVIATNIDIAFAVESVGRDYSLNRFERYFAIAKSGGVAPAIILNKVDLLPGAQRKEIQTQLKTRFPDVDIIFTSVIGDTGLDGLKKYITARKTYCFLGSSGVGKSSLINGLIGGEVIETRGISSYSGRGKHTTTKRQMYFLKNGGIVIDNPGIREVSIADARGIDASFGSISNLDRYCGYADCTHMHEPGCAVIDAVRSGNLDPEKYSNYLNLKKEAGYSEMSDFEKREKDRQFGKFIKKAKKELKDIGRKGR